MRAAVRRELWCDLALGVTALALYLATLAPGLYTLDSAELAAGAHVLGIVHATGYPVYLLLLKAWTLFLALVLGLVVKWRAVGGTGRLPGVGVLGLSLGNHMATVLLLPGLGVLRWPGIRRHRSGARAGLLMALGLAVGPLS